MLISDIFAQHAEVVARAPRRIWIGILTRWRRWAATGAADPPKGPEIDLPTVNFGGDEALFTVFQLRQLHF